MPHTTLQNQRLLREMFIDGHNMRINYHFTHLDREQRIVIEYMLLEGIETQAWYAIVRLDLLKTECLICIQ